MELEHKTFVLSGSVIPKEHQPGLTKTFLTIKIIYIGLGVSE